MFDLHETVTFVIFVVAFISTSGDAFGSVLLKDPEVKFGVDLSFVSCFCKSQTAKLWKLVTV